MEHRKNYTICLPDWNSILPKLSEIIVASYHTGDFDSFENDFVSSGDDESNWKLVGESGCNLSIELEKYEGYLFGTLSGNGDIYFSGASLLWESYLTQGGNPEAQERPE